MKQLIPIFFIIIVVSACAPDPRKEAQAYQIHEQAEQDALNQEQNRTQAGELHDLQVQALVVEQGHREATAAEWRAGLNKMIRHGFTFATIGLCVILLTSAFSFSYASIGIASATARIAMMRASLVTLDRVTRQFPLVIQHIHGTRYALHNPNTGSVVMLDRNNPADRQLIATSGATQIAGVIAQEASRSSDPAGVAIIQPTVVDVKDELLAVGKDLWRSNE